MNEGRFREVEQRMWRSVGLTPTEQRLQLARTGATVRVQEVGEGPPVVFVHGASNSGTSWAGLLAGLDGFRCIVMDRPGCGLSDPLATRFDDVDKLRAFGESLIVDVLDAMDIDKAHVVATSFGGYIALQTAAAHPDRIRRLVELGWTIGAPIAKTPLVMRLASVRFLGQMLAAIPANERAVRAILKGAGLRQALAAGRVSQEVVDTFHALLRHTDTMRNELRAGPRIITPIRGLKPQRLAPAEHAGVDHHADLLPVGRRRSVRRRRHRPRLCRAHPRSRTRGHAGCRPRSLDRRPGTRREIRRRVPRSLTYALNDGQSASVRIEWL